VEVEQDGSMAVVIRPFRNDDVAWAEQLIGAEFGGRIQARLGSTIDALAVPGFIAETDGRPVGIVTFDHRGGDVEIVYIEAVERGRGVGTALVAAVDETTNPDRLWLVTTNDNLDALRFYQRRGFRISEIHCGAVDEARRTRKPTISAVGHHGIPIRDEIVLERHRGT
jgi:ribosomal protein S18 acetylase RimI-like enzyme